MPAPERYAIAVPEMSQIWGAEGTFNGQARVWGAHVKARHLVEGAPTAAELAQINKSLILTPDEINYLNQPQGHETVKLQRLIQSKLPDNLRNYIHKGATSSDVLDTNLALQVRNSLGVLSSDFRDLEVALLSVALQHAGTLQVGRTHGQHAIPQTFGRQVLGWYSAITQSVRRIAQAREIISFGKWSGEIGTHAFVSPELESKAMEILGLTPEPTPTQVIPRWRHAEVVSLMALNMTSLESMATNIRLLALTDVGEVREPFDEHGSSAMPHKRNPELSERIVGLGRIVRGMMLAEHEAVALWLERDISHSSTERYTFPDVFQPLDYAVRLASQIIKGLVVYADRMEENLDNSHGGIYSARLLNLMIDHGVDRTLAYDTIKRLAQQAYDGRIHLRDLASHDSLISESLPGDVFRDAFNPRAYLENIGVAYQRLEIDLV